MGASLLSAGLSAADPLASATQVGEDAYFLRSDSLGVADGVGGWAGRPGANPALFSRKLMAYCSMELSRYSDTHDELYQEFYGAWRSTGSIRILAHSLSSDVDPVDVLQRSYERCIGEAQTEGMLGSSTALIALLRNDELRVANIGDCCISVIRGDEYVCECFS